MEAAAKAVEVLKPSEDLRMRARLRSLAGQARYRKQQALMKPVFGNLKVQRGMQRIRLLGLEKVIVEMALARMVFNLTHSSRVKDPPKPDELNFWRAVPPIRTSAKPNRNYA